MTALPHRPHRTGLRALRAGFAVLLAALAAAAPAGRARADGPIKGGVTVSTKDGFARLVFKFDEPVTAQIRLNWPVLVIRFEHPVDLAAVDRLAGGAPDYISAARRDPDGGAIRIALARKLKINTTPAAERYYLDMLPENWTGVMPGLPKEVVEQLAQRAREAEKLLRKQRAEDRLRTPPQVRVKVASEPTFTRFVFDLPDAVGVSPAHGKGTFTLGFDRAIKWDLADALAAIPPTLQTVKTEMRTDASTVSFVLKGAPDVRTFREDNHFVVDIGREGAAADKSAHAEGGAKASKAPRRPRPPLLAITPPATVPAPKEAMADQSATDNGLPPMIDVPAPKPPAAKPVPAAKPAPAAKLARPTGPPNPHQPLSLRPRPSPRRSCRRPTRRRWPRRKPHRSWRPHPPRRKPRQSRHPPRRPPRNIPRRARCRPACPCCCRRR